MTIQQPRTLRTLEILEADLERLKRLYGLGYNLEVVWLPGEKVMHGEVVGKTIFIYDQDPDEALETLCHEFKDYALTEATVRPLEKVANGLVELYLEDGSPDKDEMIRRLHRLVRLFMDQFQEFVYRDKERLVDAFGGDAMLGSSLNRIFDK